MSGFSKNKKLEFLNSTFSGKTYYAGLFSNFSVDLQGNEIITEVNTASYERTAIEFRATTTLETSNVATAKFPEAREDWGHVVGIGIYTERTGGELINYVLFDAKDNIQIHSLTQYEIPKDFYLLGFKD